MKILVVHNEYGKRSGEEAVVEEMERIFAGMGCEVRRLRMTTADSRDSLGGKVRAFVSGVYCPSGVRAMRDALRRHKPDVVNVHNLYPFISPAALRECRKAGVRVVMTVHNYRLLCPTGLFMREGAPCELCLERGDEWACLRYNCEGSWPKTIAYAARNAVARLRRHYLDCVDVFACITEFQRRKLVEGGIPEERTVLIPNAIALKEECENVDEGGMATGEALNGEGNGAYVGYVGRLSREKGIDLILEAARRNPDVPFKLAGSVSDPGLLENLPANVELAGFVAGSELDRFYDGARFLVMASRWYEGFPMSILEAGAHGKCMVCPAHGGFVEVITQGEETGSIGELFTPGDASALSSVVRRMWDDKERCKEYGARAREAVKARYSREAVGRKWRSLIFGQTGGNE